MQKKVALYVISPFKLPYNITYGFWVDQVQMEIDLNLRIEDLK